jgi:hypothetical protein
MNLPRDLRGHAPLRIGTLNAILKAIVKVQGVEREAILRHL